jgi:hypothetical protein
VVQVVLQVLALALRIGKRLARAAHATAALCSTALPRRSMDESNQIEPPPSFVALFASPTGHRLLEPMSTVCERYELCEDLAQMLVDQAETARFKSGGSERETLAKMELVLSHADSGLQPAEASWVLTRLAELLGWNGHAA